MESIRAEVAKFERLRYDIKLTSGDLLDMKRFEPAMRHLLDMYVRADGSEVLMDFEELSLIELIVEKAQQQLLLCRTRSAISGCDGRNHRKQRA